MTLVKVGLLSPCKSHCSTFAIITSLLLLHNCAQSTNGLESSGVSTRPSFSSIFKIGESIISDTADSAKSLISKQPISNASVIGMEFLEDIRNTSPYLSKTTVDFITMAGYPVESHAVKTEDGYTLTLHRIPRGKQETTFTSGTTKIPVLLQHGFLCTSSDWIMQSPEKALQTGLFDVWLGNLRGNKYAQVHENLTTSDDEFWDFSHDESGKWDVKAMVDFILSKTNQPKLFYIGHSMGNAVIYDFLSEQSEYNSKFKLVVSLAPAAFLKRMKSPVRLLAPFGLTQNALTNTIGSRQLNMESLKTVMQIIGPQTCIKETVNLRTLCSYGLSMFGMDVSVIDNWWVPVIFTQYPDVSSTKTLTQMLQAVRTGRFAKFDYGRLRNIEKYDSMNAPVYPLNRILAPVVVYAAKDDTLVDLEDVKDLVKELKTVKSFQIVEAEKFNHAGFLYGKEADVKVYKSILEQMKAHMN